MVGGPRCPRRVCSARSAPPTACAARCGCARSPPIRRRSRATARSRPRTAAPSRSKACGRPRITSWRRLSGIGDRDAAERLANTKLYVPRERLPDPDEADEFYHADLIGLAVVDRAGETLGTVVAVHNFGAGDLIEVRQARGRARRELVPFDAIMTDARRRSSTSPRAIVVVAKPAASGRAATSGHVARKRSHHFSGHVSRAAGRKPRRQGAGGRRLGARRRRYPRLRHRQSTARVDDTPAGGGPGMVMKRRRARPRHRRRRRPMAARAS